MKRLFTSSLIALLAAMTFTACQKDNGIEPENPADKLIEVTLSAGKPVLSSDTRTEMVGTTPYWSVGDAIGVSDGTNKNYKFTNDAQERTETTTFTGKTAVSGPLYAYYPYTDNGVSATGAKVDLPTVQTPKIAGSFDGAADFLVSKPFTLTEAGNHVGSLVFRRLTGIVKIVLKDKSTGTVLANQHVSTVTMTAATDITGRCYIDMKNATMNAPYSSQSKQVTANYTTETQYAINGTNAAYVCISPTTLEAGSELVIEAKTESYSIAKTITLPNDVVIEAGKITTLNISISDDNLTAEAQGMALPFIEDFTQWADNGTSDATAALQLSDYPADKYSATGYTYKGKGGLKLGSSKNPGYFATTELDLSEPFTVIVNAQTYGSDNSGLAVTINGTTTTIAEALAPTYTDYIYNFEPQGNKSIIKVEVTGKRGYISNFQVIKGHEVTLPPVINVTSEKPIQVGADGDICTITYTIDNPVEGATVTAAVEEGNTWINSFDMDTVGEISFAVDANTDSAAREGSITISYPGATDVTVKVAQAGAQGENPNPGQDGSVEFDFTTGYANAAEITNVTKSPITVTFAKGSNNNTPKYYTSGTAVRAYGGNTITINGANITKVEFTLTQDLTTTNYFTANTGSIVNKSRAVTWEGNTSNVIFTVGGSSGQARIQKIVVTYGEGGGETPTPEPSIVKVDPESLSFAAAGESKTVTVTTANADGCTIDASVDNAQFSAEVAGNTVTVTAAANESDAAITGTLTINLMKDGVAVDTKTVTLSQAKKSEGGSTENSWHLETWNLLNQGTTSYGAGTISGDLGSWTYTGCSGYDKDQFNTKQSLALGQTSDKSIITSPTFTTGIAGIKFNYFVNNVARTIVVTIYEDGQKVKEETIKASKANTLESAVIDFTTTGPTYFTFTPGSTSRRASVGDIEVNF